MYLIIFGTQLILELSQLSCQFVLFFKEKNNYVKHIVYETISIIPRISFKLPQYITNFPNSHVIIFNQLLPTMLMQPYPVFNHVKLLKPCLNVISNFTLLQTIRTISKIKYMQIQWRNLDKLMLSYFIPITALNRNNITLTLLNRLCKIDYDADP